MRTGWEQDFNTLLLLLHVQDEDHSFPTFQRSLINHSTHFFTSNMEELTARADACESSDPASNVTDRLNTLLKNSGDGYVLQLCPNETYLIQAPIVFASPNQEISTAGYPTDDDRALLVVSGPIFSNGTGHTTAVDGTCSTCSNVMLRNIQVCRNILDPHLPF
jgi:hypothetical protein